MIGSPRKLFLRLGPPLLGRLRFLFFFYIFSSYFKTITSSEYIKSSARRERENFKGKQVGTEGGKEGGRERDKQTDIRRKERKNRIFYVLAVRCMTQRHEGYNAGASEPAHAPQSTRWTDSTFILLKEHYRCPACAAVCPRVTC